MAKPGPKKKPAQVKVLHGNPGKRKIEKDLAVEVAIPEPPTSWKKKKKAERDKLLAVWTPTTERLADIGIIAEIDAILIAQYCQCVVRKDNAQAVLDDEGETYMTRGKSGDMWRLRPEYTIVRDMEKEIRAISEQFGMSPSARTRFSDPRQMKLPGMDNWNGFE